MLFEGYTGGGGKEVVDGLMSTGDVGYLDDAGRLYVVGREDDMVVSGGENLYPSEVESCLAGHPDVVDVAVVGVPDDDFGQRLRAVVVLVPGVAADEETGEALRAWVRTGSRGSASRGRWRSSTSCRATRPARCSAASCDPAAGAATPGSAVAGGA